MLVYDGVDPQGGLQYSRYDRTRVESVFKEAMRKEKDIRSQHSKVTSFQMNLANSNTKGSLQTLKHSHNPNMIISEKVHKRTPLERNTTPPKRPGDDYGNSLIRHSEKYPWQKIDLPQSRSQEVGWLIAASMRSETLNAQRSHSRTTGAVGKARKQAYSTATLFDLSGGKVGGDTSQAEASGTMSMSRSAPQLPRLIPHLPDEGMRPEAQMLNNPRWRHPQKRCAITDYADKYFAVMRHGPFNQAAARAGAPL
jgi:hypothetical protein